MPDNVVIHGKSTTQTVSGDSNKYVDVPVNVTSGNLAVAEQGNTTGLRNPSSSTNSYLVAFGNFNATRCDIDTTETLVTNAPCLVFAVFGNDGNTGYTDLIDAAATGGGSTPVLRVNAGDGTADKWLGGARFENGLCVDGESVGHDVTILWRPIA